jgi:CHAT domain-containing protein
MTALLVITHVPPAVGQDVTVRKSAQHEKQAEELLNSALVLIDTNDRALASRRLQEAMSLWIEAHETEKAARAALQLGDGYKYARDYLASLHCYKKALEVSRLSGSLKATLHNAIGQVYAQLYQLKLAKDYFTEAILLARRVNDLSAEALALSELADLHYRQGERDQALSRAARARRLNRRRGDPGAEAALLHLTGRINQEDGLVEQARTAYEEALTIYRQTGDLNGHAKVLCSMTSLSLLRLDTRAALDQSNEAVTLAKTQTQRAAGNADKLRARDLRWRAALSRARAERAAGQKELAVNSCFQAYIDAEATWVLEKISTETTAIAFRQETQQLYRECADLFVEQGDVSSAFWQADVAKAKVIRGLTEARRKKETTRRRDQPENIRELYRSIARLRTQMVTSHTREEFGKLQDKLRDAEAALDEERVQVETTDSQDRIVWSKPATVQWLQGRLARDESALLEFLLGETRSFVWLITPDAVSYQILPSRKEIENAVRPFLKAITTTPNHLYLERELAKTKKQGAELFLILFGDLAHQIKKSKKIIVVPDGLLHYLPFESLIHDNRYLIQDHEISYNPSASMLSLWNDSLNVTKGRNKMELLAFGDPVFEPQATARNVKNPARRLDRRTNRVRAQQGYTLTQLPRTRDEVLDIAKLFPPDRRRVYLGQESTEDAVKRESLRDYKRVHFATHSLTYEEYPSRSCVVLSRDNDPQEDGVLEVREIIDLDLDCDLVVLSACQTGRGRLFSGEGIVGLSRAFVGAGARSVVVSLWNVSDIATSRLMKAFYQQLVANVGNAAALREAKLQMPELAREFRHPYYWASFVIIGNP